jgi:hypothetical protein
MARQSTGMYGIPNISSISFTMPSMRSTSSHCTPARTPSSRSSSRCGRRKKHQALLDRAHVGGEGGVGGELREHGRVLRGVGEVAKCAVGHEGAGVGRLGRDLPVENLGLVAVDDLQARTDPVQVLLHLGQHAARDLRDHRQAVVVANPARQRGLCP